MPTYQMQVRDLVHGYIGFTKLEKQVVDHPLFQRLRNVRQADVAHFVYPSSNISRFEHALGTCHVAGRMARNLFESKKAGDYFNALQAKTGLTQEQFVETVRLYALLHDIGHLPLSHLFERALENYVQARRISLKSLTTKWFGKSDFEKPHEAFGAVLVRRILQSSDVNKLLDKAVRRALLQLTTRKHLKRDDLLNPIKHLVDSVVDADRIDFVKRDGLLAGREYGNYDIDRLTSAVFLHQDSEGVWHLMYSEGAVSTLEALLFDRYRTFTYINFHHRVVITKLLTRYLIQRLIERGTVGAKHFRADDAKLATRNDIWLWNLIQEMDPRGDEKIELAKRALLERNKDITLSLWRNRSGYKKLFDEMVNSTFPLLKKTTFPAGIQEEAYGRFLSRKMGVSVFVFDPGFSPVGNDLVWLYNTKKMEPTGQHLFQVSELLSSLQNIWLREPQLHVLVLGKDVKKKEGFDWKRLWAEATAEWLRKRQK